MIWSGWALNTITCLLPPLPPLPHAWIQNWACGLAPTRLGQGVEELSMICALVSKPEYLFSFFVLQETLPPPHRTPHPHLFLSHSDMTGLIGRTISLFNFLQENGSPTPSSFCLLYSATCIPTFLHIPFPTHLPSSFLSALPSSACLYDLHLLLFTFCFYLQTVSV